MAAIGFDIELVDKGITHAYFNAPIWIIKPVAVIYSFLDMQKVYKIIEKVEKENTQEWVVINEFVKIRTTKVRGS